MSDVAHNYWTVDARPAENVARLLALREVGVCRPVRRREGTTVLTTVCGTEPGSHAAPGEKGFKHCCGPGGTGSEKVKKLLLEWWVPRTL